MKSFFRPIGAVSVILTLLLLSGCRKEDKSEYRVSVQVKETGTDVPVPDATIHVIKYASGGGAGPYKDIETNHLGTADFVLPKEEGFGYKINADGPQYTFEESVFLDPGENNVTLYAAPYSWVEVHAVNVTPYDQDDYFSTVKISGQGIYGMNVDTTFIVGPFKGGRNYEFFWHVIKNQNVNTYSRNIWLPGHDTVSVDIDY